MLLVLGLAIAETGLDLSQLTPEQLAALQAQIDALTAQTDSDAPKTSLEILTAMIAEGAPIDNDKLQDFDETTDPNGLLGTLGSYTSKTDFGCPGYAKDSQGYYVGGTLEVFEEEQQATNRYNYLAAVYSSGAVSIDVHLYQRGSTVFRTSLSLKDDESRALLAAFESVVPGTTLALNPLPEEVEEPITVTNAPEPAESTAGLHTAAEYIQLQKGSKGAAVAQMQARLKELGFLNDVADGAFGGNTERAVMAFQEANGLSPTGIATPEDQAILFNAGVVSSTGVTATAYDPYATCPAEISRVALKDSYGTPYVSFTVTNICPSTIKAFTYEVEFYDAFGDRMSGYTSSKFEANYSGELVSMKSVSINTRDSYEMYDYNGCATAKVAITRIMMSDGTDISYTDPTWFEGK